MFEHNKLERLAIDGPKSVLVVKADFNEDIVNMLHEGAEEEIEAWGGKSEVVTVPGALEIPTAISIAERELSLQRLCGPRMRHQGRNNALRDRVQ